jgi:hypothetical protein
VSGRRSIAVIDPAHPEEIERFPDVLRRSLLARMRHRKEPGVAGAAKHVLELARRVADLRGIESDAHDAIAIGQREIECFLRVGLVEMAQEAHDEVCVDAELAPAVRDRASETINDG